MYFTKTHGIVNCQDCYDTGVNFIELEDGSTEMLCSCTCEAERWEGLTSWKELKDKASLLSFPFAWFKPGKDETLQQKSSEWKAKISVAKDFWKHYRLETGETNARS